MTIYLAITSIIALLLSVSIIIWVVVSNSRMSHNLNNFVSRFEERDRLNSDLKENLMRLIFEQQQAQHELRSKFDEHQIKNLKLLIESLQSGMADIRNQISSILNHNSETISKQVEKLTHDTDNRLKEISGQVEKRLSEGFEKTAATFNDVVKRLAMIDEAQKKITDLSSNVISLQEILTDKRSRGAFGEVQLSALLSNVLPAEHFSLQCTLSNGKRVDCLLILPDPTGKVAIDAKFPLENYRRMTDVNLSETERMSAKSTFKLDIRKHMQDIAEKYIIPGETADGAVMFIPAEAVFAEIHACHPELIEQSHRLKVWMVSPTTMMAILTTARAVIKDAATRKQVHIIQEHLVHLGKDFTRFQARMDNLAKHINLAHSDIEEVHKSSKKLTSRFSSIEQVEVTQIEN